LIELSAYRIVQEALTNLLKHGGDPRASVRVHYGTDSLELEIVDDGTGAPPRVSIGGHGLVGMGERVALYGGRVRARLLGLSCASKATIVRTWYSVLSAKAAGAMRGNRGFAGRTDFTHPTPLRLQGAFSNGPCATVLTSSSRCVPSRATTC
jgi:hypothetical protein